MSGSHVVQSLQISHNPQPSGIQSNFTLHRLFSQDSKLAISASLAPCRGPNIFLHHSCSTSPKTCYQTEPSSFPHFSSLLFFSNECFCLSRQYTLVTKSDWSKNCTIRSFYLPQPRLSLPGAITMSRHWRQSGVSNQSITLFPTQMVASIPSIEP